MPCHACLAEPSPATLRLTKTLRACLALRHQNMPGHACLAVPHCAIPKPAAPCLPCRTQPNEVVVQATSFFNVNFNWAGFALRVIE